VTRGVERPEQPDEPDSPDQPPGVSGPEAADEPPGASRPDEASGSPGATELADPVAGGEAAAFAPSDGPEVAVIGAATVDYAYDVTNLPAADGGAFARGVDPSPGGVGANVAVALSRLGRTAGLIARVGEDDHGRRIRAALDATAVDAARVRSGPEESTHCLVFRDRDGERSIVAAGESARALRLDDRDAAYLRGADAVVMTAYAPDPVARRVASLAGDSTVPPVALDLSGPPAELVDRGASPRALDRLQARCDLLTAGEAAARAHFGAAGAAVDALSDGPVPRAAVTRGEAGATLVAGDRAVDVPAFGVDVVDTTGAGDAFLAGLVDRWLLADESPAAAGRYAAAAAAINCTAPGAQGALPTAAAVRSFLADRG